MQQRRHGSPPARWLRIRRVLTVLFVAGALYATALSFLWFAADFIAASIYSPNLDQAQQVADFNDFAYIAERLSGYRFRYGALALVMAVALLVLAVLINDPRSGSRPLFIAGGVALATQALLLAQGFQTGFALLFVATAVMLYLTADGVLPAPADVSLPDATETGTAETEGMPAAREPDEATETGPRLPEAFAAHDLAQPDAPDGKGEPRLPAVEVESVDTMDEGGADPVEDGAEPPAADGSETPDEADVTSLGLEIESDLNLDLEPDYELAQAPETEQDPLLLLSQEDLGIEPETVDLSSLDDTIETAAAIEAEVSREFAEERPGTTTQLGALIERADDDPIGEVAKELNAPPPGFDPQALAREESLLPPPRQRVWNLLDWMILAVIVVAIAALLLLNF